MLIKEVSEKTGIPAHTIRFYEKKGLIKGIQENTSNNYRNYSNETCERLELIKEAQSVGFTLDEIHSLIDAWYGKRISMKKKISILDKKLIEINLKIDRLKQVKKQIALFKEEILKYDC